MTNTQTFSEGGVGWFAGAWFDKYRSGTDGVYDSLDDAIESLRDCRTLALLNGIADGITYTVAQVRL